MSGVGVLSFLISFAVFLQTLELLSLRAVWSEQGIWRASILSRPLRQGRFVFSAPAILALLVGMAVVSVVSGLGAFSGALSVRPSGSVAPELLWFLFFGTWFIAVRFRGTFNGGSDAMTLVVLLGAAVSATASGAASVAVGVRITDAALAYVALQLTASYFVAGISKLREPRWRDGTALLYFFTLPTYRVPAGPVRALLSDAWMSRVACYGVLLFELSFPLAWVSRELCVLYLMLGSCFHLANFWVLGLNRFVFAWLAAYPALYHWAGR